MGEAKPFPIDFDALERGQVVPMEFIRGWRGHTPGSREFDIDKMQLAQRIKDYFRDSRGDIVSVRMPGDTLHILTHQQQNDYVPKSQRAALRQFARRHAEDQGIDPTQLSIDEQARRDDRLRKSSWLIQQSRKRAPPQLGAGEAKP